MKQEDDWRPIPRTLSRLERNDKDASKPVARHFNFPNHAKRHMAVYSLSLHLGSSKSRKAQEQNFFFTLAPLVSTMSTSALHPSDLFLFSRHHIPTNSAASFSAYKPTHNPQFLQSFWRRANSLRWPVYVINSVYNTKLFVITISAWIRIKVRILLGLF